MPHAEVHSSPGVPNAGEEECSFVELETAVAYDDLISSIYREASEASPWVRALEKLRQLLNANVACLRIALRDSSSPQQLYAAGPLASPQALHDWEHHHSRDLLPFDPYEDWAFHHRQRLQLRYRELLRRAGRSPVSS